MRRSDRELTQRQQLEELLVAGREMQLAMHDDESPYVLPLNYGYADGCLYFHCALQGKKLDCLRANPKVGFCVSEVVKRIDGDKPCDWSTRFRSVIGNGTAEIIADRDGKIAGYDIIMRQFGGPVGNYEEKNLTGSLVVKVTIDKMTGKQSPQD
jgi:nitroimidazol reductase NimA-like FMN-containing flavoprotein (pyridoxamine 5'-phosphate oxidase superfamily)